MLVTRFGSLFELSAIISPGHLSWLAASMNFVDFADCAIFKFQQKELIPWVVLAVAVIITHSIAYSPSFLLH